MIDKLSATFSIHLIVHQSNRVGVWKTVNVYLELSLSFKYRFQKLTVVTFTFV